MDSKQAVNFFARGLINELLIHERFIETPPEDMNEVQANAKGIFRMKESRQMMAQNETIAIAQNNTTSMPSKYYEAKKKPKEIQQRSRG